MPEPEYEITTDDPRPMCDNPHPIVDVIYECFHVVDIDGVPCATNGVIKSVLDTATCRFYMGRSGSPQCNVGPDPLERPAITQYIYETSCPAQITKFFLWHLLWYGCEQECTPFSMGAACPTDPVDPTLDPIDIYYKDIPRRVVGCDP